MTALDIDAKAAASAAAAVDISVIICTRNRVALLRQTLASLSRVNVPAGLSVEAFIVDNGSADGSADVIRDFRWPGVTVHRPHFAEPGLARCQNLVLREARGRVIMFLDDDVQAPVNWLTELSEPVLAGEADAVGGGVVIPDAVRPPWMKPEHEEWLASTAHWEATREPVLVGASMAIGRQVFRAIGDFDVDCPSAPDTMFSYRLVAAGFRLALRHDLVVEHWVDRSRFTRVGLERQAKLRAESQVFVVHHWENRRLWFAHLRWLWTRLRLAMRRAALGRLTNDNLALPEMRLMQQATFWPAYIRRRNDPVKYRRSERRFVLVTTGYPGFTPHTPGGIETYARLMTTSLLALGWRVNVVCMLDSGPIPAYRQIGNLTLRGVRLPRVHWRFAALRPFIHGLAVLRAMPWIHRPDVIEVPNEGGIGWATAMAFRRRCCVRLHTTPLQHEAFAEESSGAADRAVIRWDRITTRRARCLLAGTHAHARLVAEQAGVPLERFKVVPLGVFPPAPAATGSTRDRVLFVGGMERRKGVDIFFRAAAIANERALPLRWTAVGRWAARWQAEAQAGRVEAIDAPSDADLQRYWAETRFVVVPSRYESFGLVSVEAMARGIVVIASRIAAFEEVIGDSGVLTTPERADEIVDAIERLQADPEREAALAAAALARYRATYSLEAFERRLDQLHSRVAGVRR